MAMSATMTLKVSTRFDGGNAADIEILSGQEIPEIRFASDPCGGKEALWFHFRLEESDPDPARNSKVRITWKYFDSMAGASELPLCIPVSGMPDRTWSRLKQGEESRSQDGMRQLSWLIPHPAPAVEVALCFPYLTSDLDALLERSTEFWNSTPLGLSQNGNRITRVHNTIGIPGSNQPGFYILARQHAGETPGSWVLDGLLRYWSQVKKGGYTIWAIPFVDIDGVKWGHFGPDGFPHDMERSWSNPPLRRETKIVTQDILNWKSRCRPALILDFHSPGVCEREGVFAFSGTESDGTFAEETKWCNVLKHELQSEFAAPNFQRQDSCVSSIAHPPFSHFARNAWGIPALNIQIPYAQAAGNILTQKNYREVGKRIGQAMHRRNG